MCRTGKKTPLNLVEPVSEALERYPDLIRMFPANTVLNRIQSSRYDSNPVNYRRISGTRYADPDAEVGVFYLGFSQEVAVAESFQSGLDLANPAVAISRLEQSSMHQFKMARALKLIDVSGLANRIGHKLRDIVQAKGQGAQGYLTTQALSQACMQYSKRVDGLVYPSAVYSPAGTLNGCNAVLFEGRGLQVTSTGFQPVIKIILTNGETAFELLESLGVVLE